MTKACAKALLSRAVFISDYPNSKSALINGKDWQETDEDGPG